VSKMNTYHISVRVDGYEYYTVDAKDEEEAIQAIKDGEGYLQSSEVEWNGDFYVDSVEDI